MQQIVILIVLSFLNWLIFGASMVDKKPFFSDSCKLAAIAEREVLPSVF